MHVANEAIGGHAPHGTHAAMHAVAHGASQKRYVVGFLLAVVLTAIPFALVMSGSVAGTPTLIAGFAVAQIVVHVIYFLHVNGSEEQRWNLMALLYTAIVVGIVLGGSIWIMHHLDLNMLPGMMHGSMS